MPKTREWAIVSFIARTTTYHAENPRRNQLESILQLLLNHSNGQRLDLTPETQRIRALLRSESLLSVCGYRGNESLLVSLIDFHPFLFLISRFLQVMSVWRREECCFESFRGRRNSGGVAKRGELAFICISAASKVVGGALPRKGFVAELFEVTPGI